jgi:hypothetical protein
MEFEDAPASADARNVGRHQPSDQSMPEPERSSGLRVFRATRQEDISAVRDIAREFHAESRYAHVPFSEQKFARFFARAISDSDSALAVVVQYRGRTVGLLHAGVGDYYLGEGGRLVTVYALYVSASIRRTLLGGRVGVRLLRLVGSWAKIKGAAEVHVHSTSGINPRRTDKLMRHLGFEVYGGSYGFETNFD